MHSGFSLAKEALKKPQELPTDSPGTLRRFLFWQTAAVACLWCFGVTRILTSWFLIIFWWSLDVYLHIAFLLLIQNNVIYVYNSILYNLNQSLIISLTVSRCLCILSAFCNGIFLWCVVYITKIDNNNNKFATALEYCQCPDKATNPLLVVTMHCYSP